MRKEFNIEKVTELLRHLREALPNSPKDFEGVSTQRGKHLRNEVETLLIKLKLLAERLDPIRRPEFVFDPSNPEFVGKLIGRTLLEQPRSPLGELPKFYGSGVYAIYYTGAYSAYKPIRKKETPIYVGKADPPTPDAKSVTEQGPKLCIRLGEHAKSIRAATSTLSIDDFECRFLVVQSGWQRSAEDYLIHSFHPIWNQIICYGFGKHGDAPGTRKNTRSPWDTIHPGRDWATREGNKENPLTIDQIKEQIAEHYRKHVPKI